jgi:tetratricopeptide (TPR) repeat protein
MKYFRHLLKIKYLVCFLLLLANFNVLAQNEKQQLNLANSLERNREYEVALKIYKNLEKNIKTKSNARQGIQKCLKGLQQYDELVAFLEKIVKENKSNNRNVNSLAEAYLLNSEKDKAIELWNSLLNNKKKDIGTYRMVAGSMIKNRMVDNAVEVYELALLNLKDQQILHLDLANLFKSTLNMEKAAHHFLAYYGNYPKQKKFLQRQILNLTKSEQHVEKVAEVLNDYIDKHKNKLFVKEILGGLYIKSRQFNSAYQIYFSLEASKEDGSFLFKFGKEAQKNKAFDFATKAFNKILENEKHKIYYNTYFQLATTHYMIALENRQANESIAKAIQMFENLVSKNSINIYSDLSCVLLGDIYLDIYFDLDKAIYYYDYLIKKYPKSKKLSESLIKLGDSYLIKGDLARSKESYLKNKNPKSLSLTTFKQAELEYFQGNLSQALKKYNMIVEKIGIKDSLANNSLERTILINSFKSDSLDLKSFAHGELLIFQQKYSEAVEHLNKLLIKKNSISSTAGKVMTDILTKLEKYSEANAILKDLIEQYPDDYFADEFLFKSAVIEEIQGNFQKSFELYQTLLNKFETSLYYEKARENARILSEKIKNEQVSG